MPKLLPAPGYTYEGVHGESNGLRMLIATWTTLSIAIIAVTLRITVKWFIVPRVRWEDYFAIFAAVLSLARTILLTLLWQHHQFGQHIWDVQKPNFDPLYTWAKGATLIYLVAIVCAKISILLLYVRLFRINRLFRYVCYTLMGLVVTYCMAIALATIFQCRPVRAGWNFFLKGDCVSLQDIAVATGALNIATDLAIVIAPIPVVLKLQLKPAKMAGLLLMFSTGFFIVVVTIVREVQVVRAPSHYDSTWTDASRVLWLSVELNIGIACTCLPLLSPLGRKLPGAEYFKGQYKSAVSLIRGSRKRSSGDRSTDQNQRPNKAENGVYLELKHGDEKIRELNPQSQAIVYGSS